MTSNMLTIEPSISIPEELASGSIPQNPNEASGSEDTSEANGSTGRQTAKLLIDLARINCVFFHDPDSEPFAVFENKGHRECWSLKSTGFKDWLFFRFYQEHSRVPTETANSSAVAMLAGEARFGGEQRPVFIRVAKYEEAIYIDLCNDAWQVLEVTNKGWRVLDESPVMFVRSPSMRALTMPTHRGDVRGLWKLINIPESERLILLVWILECFRVNTPFPLLELTGEQGSAKSSTQFFLRELIDPNKSNNRGVPKSVEDIVVSAKNGHLVSYENLSHLSPPFQDALCTLSTGGGFSSRTLYTNSEETVIDLKRPVILNGISPIVTAYDLLDRTIHIELPRIHARVTTDELHRLFDESKASILGGLLDLFVSTLQLLPKVRYDERLLPRMADFALLGEAAFQAMGQGEGKFLAGYMGKRQADFCRSIESSPVGTAALAFLKEVPKGFEGTVKELFEKLSKHRTQGDLFPKSPKGFADALRQVAPALRGMGIVATISEKPGRYGYHCILKQEDS